MARAGHVQVTQLDLEANRCEAVVNGNDRNEVLIRFDRQSAPLAECTCPKLGSVRTFCQHIAAVLVRLHEIQQFGEQSLNAHGNDRAAGLTPVGSHHVDAEQLAPEARLDPAQAAGRILELFDERPARPMRNRALSETRTVLRVEFILKLLSMNPRTSLFGIELRIGLRNLYIVRKLQDFLDQLARGESSVITPRFIYDPELHSFTPEDEKVLLGLIDLMNEQSVYQDPGRLDSAYAASLGNDRMMVFPPRAWKQLLPHLQRASSVTISDGARKISGLHLSDEPLPVRFTFGQADDDSCYLHVEGLDRVTVMEGYEQAFCSGTIRSLSAKGSKQLAELKAIVEASGTERIPIPRSQVSAFIETAVPGLKKLGSVAIDPAIRERIAQYPLQAKLYLDRIRDRLLIGVEFQYGEVLLNPLEEERKQLGASRILIRDHDRERQILDIIERDYVTRTEAGYFISEEEAEFEFLYSVVPQLRPLMHIYATTAVKLRVYRLDEMPKIRVEVSRDKTINWLEFRLNMGWIPESEIRSLIQALEEKRRYYRLPNGALLPLNHEELRELSKFLSEAGFTHADIEDSAIRVPLLHGLPIADRDYQGLKLNRAVRQLLDDLKHPDNLDFPIPDSLQDVLRDYQKFGFQWMKMLAHYGFGGILADDMGLGKTVQSIAFIASVLPEIRSERMPALVIAPSSLLYNWRSELQKFTPEIRVLIADGPARERAEKLQRLCDESGCDVVLTSYPLLLRDVKHYAERTFHTLILDEAQMFKNHTTQTARALKKLRARHRFALTGTPLENRLEELWSIFHVVFPELFQDRLAFANLPSQLVARRARPFMLRRWKRDVLQDLPDKVESVKLAELTSDQKRLYTAYLAKLQQETLKHLSENGFQKSRIKILSGLTRLRQICCHPALFVEGYRGRSAKLEQLQEIVAECLANRKRMLIFSQFTTMLGMIGRTLHDAGVPYFYLDGSTPTRDRVELCERFNNGEMDVFLISTKAGGTGLNLTGADTVILYDLWWNPAVDEQAADRAHRIGQKQTVHVIRLIAKDTMEEKMYELQHRKKELIDEVLGRGGEPDELGTLTEEELREILMIG